MIWSNCCKMAINQIKEVELCEFDKPDIEENNKFNEHNNVP